MANNLAIGVIETKGLVALTAGIEAMCKTADVQCIAVYKVGMGYLTATIEGSVASVRQAMEVGEAAVAQYGELRGARMYPKPADTSMSVADNGSRAALGASPQNAIGQGQK